MFRGSPNGLIRSACPQAGSTVHNLGRTSRPLGRIALIAVQIMRRAHSGFVGEAEAVGMAVAVGAGWGGRAASPAPVEPAGSG